MYIRRCLGDSYNYGMGSNNDFGIGGPKVRFGSLADILTSPRHGPLFPPKQTFVSASCDVRYVPQADIPIRRSATSGVSAWTRAILVCST